MVSDLPPVGTDCYGGRCGTSDYVVGEYDYVPIDCCLVCVGEVFLNSPEDS